MDYAVTHGVDWIGAVGYIHSGVVIQQLGVLSGVFTTQFEHKIIEIHYHI